MLKPEHRKAAGRRALRYESDLTDAEWPGRYVSSTIRTFSSVDQRGRVPGGSLIA